MDSISKDVKSGSSCDICQHKYEVKPASHVCKQCRLFFCPACCERHTDLPASKDHVLIELAVQIADRDDQTDVTQHQRIRTTARRNIRSFDAETEKEDAIVDSDYECQEGLSTLFNAPENAVLTKVAEFEAPFSVRQMFCLPYGRICVDTGDEIIIYSKDYHRQFAIQYSDFSCVIHTSGNTIAILDYFLKIERLMITEKDTKVMDNVTLAIPTEIYSCRPSVQKLSTILCGFESSRPAFFFGDDQYSLIFHEMESGIVPVWCTFSLDGKPLRTIVLDIETLSTRKEVTVVQNHKEMCITSNYGLMIYNQHRGYKYEEPLQVYKNNSNSTLKCIYIDGDYVIYQENYEISEEIFRSMSQTIRKFHLIIVERGTIKKRTFSDFTTRPRCVVLQNSLDRIIIYDEGNKCTVFELIPKDNKK